jgi:Ala-tRNA(Pro) deacylase
MNIPEFLDRNNVAFDVWPHYKTYEAQRMAQAVHVSGHHVAKTVLLRMGESDEFVVVVLPATRNIDFEEAQKVFGVGQVELATEREVSVHCPDCDVGALPPFGSQYDMKTVIDQSLTNDDEIVFESNTHSEAIRMKYDDFVQLENPEVVSISQVRVAGV